MSRHNRNVGSPCSQGSSVGAGDGGPAADDPPGLQQLQQPGGDAGARDGTVFHAVVTELSQELLAECCHSDSSIEF